VRVAVRRLHFHHARADFQHGNIECAAAQVVYGDRLVALFYPIRTPAPAAVGSLMMRTNL